MPKLFLLGEVLLRLQTKKNELHFDNLEVIMGGAAFNVAMNTAYLGNESSMVSVIPENFIGNRLISTARAANSDTSNLIQTPGNMGIYFVEKGFGMNSTSVAYNRAHSAFADETQLLESLEFGKEGDILHLTGITLLVSELAFNTALNVVKKAKAKGMKISFDFNYRSKMAGYEIAKPRYEKFLALADMIFATKRDFTAILGWDANLTEREIFEKVFEETNVKFVSHTNRSTSNTLAGLETVVFTPKGEFTSGVQLFPMIERIGGGDGFVSGVLDGVLNGLDSQLIAKQANAMAILKQSIYGDFTNIDKDQLNEFMNNYSSEVSR